MRGTLLLIRVWFCRQLTRIRFCRPLRMFLSTVVSMNALTPRSSTRLSHASCWLSSHSGIPGDQELSNRPLELPLAFIENFHSSHRKKRKHITMNSPGLERSPHTLVPITYSPPFFMSLRKEMWGMQDLGFWQRKRMEGLQNLTWSLRESSISRYFLTYG